MTTVYGYSDDCVEIDGPHYYMPDEISCFDCDIRIWFDDETIIRLHYGKDDKAIWQIIVEQKGSQPYQLTICNDEDARIYSDVFKTEAKVLRHDVL